MAHFELPPGETSTAVAHRTVEEVWFFLGGRGEMWRRQGYAALPAISGSHSAVTQSFTPPSTLPNATGQAVFTRVDANLAPVTSESGRQSLAVTVTWNGASTNHGAVTLTTLMTNSDAS